MCVYIHVYISKPSGWSASTNDYAILVGTEKGSNMNFLVPHKCPSASSFLGLLLDPEPSIIIRPDELRGCLCFRFWGPSLRVGTVI